MSEHAADIIRVDNFLSRVSFPDMFGYGEATVTCLLSQDLLNERNANDRHANLVKVRVRIPTKLLNGEVSIVSVVKPIHAGPSVSDESLMSQVVALVGYMMLHELQERSQLDHKQWLDPHKHELFPLTHEFKHPNLGRAK